MRRLLLLPLLLSLGFKPAPLYGASAPSSSVVSASNENAEERAEREKAISESIKANEERKKAREAWLALPEEQRKKETERKARLPLPEDGYDWHGDVATHKLTATDQVLLQKQKFVIGRTEFKQSFEPYDQPKDPVFITSDSLLNVYHVLFEDSFRELEVRRASQLKGYLESMLTKARDVTAKLPNPPEETRASWLHAQKAVAPAMVLLGTSLDFFDASLRQEIEAAVDRIREAKGTRLPDWLAPATPDFLGIDYNRFRPVGLYVGSSLLGDYFRAVRWLQLIPFRIERDTELGAITLLCAEMPRSKSYPRRSYLESYDNFLGHPDGRTLSQAPCINNNSKALTFRATLEEARKWLKPSSSKVNDALRLPSNNQQTEHAEPFHLLSSYALPESVVFQSLIDRSKGITGLQFAALNGSSWAYSALEAHQRDPVLDTEISKKANAWERGEENLYTKYQGVIASLFENPDQDAPAFLKTEAWSAKSCQTALASWVQMRHTFTLQAKVSFSATCAFTRPPGFIEPNPAFLRTYVNLIQATRAKLKEFSLFEGSFESVANSLCEKADLCDQYVALSKSMNPRKLQETLVGQKVFELIQTSVLFEVLPDDDLSIAAFRAVLDGYEANKLPEALPSFARHLRDMATQYRTRKLPLPEESEWRSLKARWNKLESLATRMEALLQKQLRQRDWNKEESAFIERYGADMAYLMGYFGNVHTPQDDSPRWVEIANYPNKGTLFAVATGRPRPIFVLYPWHGVEVLCVGAVSPYFECESTERLTDAEWTQTLNKPNAVQLPKWSRSLFLAPHAANPQ